MKQLKAWACALIALCGLMASVTPAWADAWPAKAIKLVIPAPPGSPIDVVSRMLASHLQTDLGQAVVVDNRPGADGSIAASLVAKSPADGHTLLLGNAGIFTINPGYSDKLSYNPATEFAPIGRLATAVLVVSAHPLPEVKTLGDLVALSKRQPGRLSYASSTGRSGLAYLNGELLKARSGASLTWVGYSQDTQALNDLLAGRIALYIDALGTSLPHHRAGKLKILAVTGEKRAPQIPDVPTIIESGFAGVSGEAWVGLFAPAGTPPEVINRVNQGMQSALANKEISERLIGFGFDPALSSPARLGEIIRQDGGRWSKLIRELDLRRE